MQQLCPTLIALPPGYRMFGLDITVIPCDGQVSVILATLPTLTDSPESSAMYPVPVSRTLFTLQ